MAKAKTTTEQLLAMLDPEAQARVRADPAFATVEAQDRQSTDLLDIYQGEDENGTPANPPVAAKPAAATVSTPPPASPSGSADVLAKLNEMSTTLDTRFKDMEKRFVPVDKLPEYRNDILAAATRAADDYATVREGHRAEFGEAIDRALFEKFILEQQAAGVRFKDMKAAHDSFVVEKRTAAQIAKGVQDGLKQSKSGTEVPGQTDTTGASPALATIAAAKAKAAGGGKSAAMAAAERLKQMREQRENAASGVVQ